MSTNNWKIQDSLFYPLGLFNSSSKTKIVFVTWTFDCLLTYIFKKSGDTSSLKETYKVLIDGVIQDIIVTEYNTLVLTTDGHVHYFSSCKNIRKLKFLSGIKCMSSREDGFALIRVNEENSVLLETFEDFSNANAVESQRHFFDISFDEVYLFNSSWKDETFSLLAVTVNDENKSFLDLIAKKIINSPEIYFFTVSNSLFCLLPSQDNYEISLIITEPSQIEKIRLMQSVHAILIFLSCGSIDIIYYSHLTNLLDRTMHIINSNVIASTFANDCFFYSDDHKIYKIEVTYDEIENICVVNEQSKPFRNIIALTWVQSIQKLVCLSENNIFYRTKFAKYATFESQSADLFELTDKKLNEIERILQHTVDLVDEPNKIHKEIECEVFKQELIAIAKRKEMYSNLVSAVVTFHNVAPAIKTTTFFQDSGLYSPRDYYFVNINFKIAWNDIFRTGLWNIVINLSAQFDIFKILKIDKSIIKSEFNVLIPVPKDEFVIPPNILVEIASFIKVERDFAYTALPVKIKNVEISNIFTPIPLCIKNFRKNTSKIDDILCSLAEKGNPFSDFKQSEKMFSAKLRTPLIMSMTDLYEIFSIKENQCHETSDIELYFLGNKVTLSYLEAESYLHICAENPIALFYAKLCTIKGLSNEYYDDEPINVQEALVRLTKIQCNVEGRYGSGCSVRGYAASLNRLYTNLRSDVIKQF